MPPKDSTTRKKSRVEVREEFYLAMQRQQQQPSQASQHTDGPSGSQQESPVLPLVLPIPSTRSTTGSTGPTDPTPPIRSIRCSFVTTHLPTESGTAGASSSNKRRGIVIGKKTATITKEKGRTLLTYDDSVRGPPIAIRSRFVADLSAYIKDRCPMLYPSWFDIPETERTRLLEFLSVNYDIDPRRIKELSAWIDEKAGNRFREWKSYCHTDWQEKGDEPLPVEFTHRPAEWEWLCNHFKDPRFQKKSEQMKAIRASINKKSHSGGAKPFVARVDVYTKKGEQAPHSKTYIDMYKKFDPEGTSRVQQASDEAIASLMASMPPIEDTSDGSSPASVTAPPRLPVDVEIGVMERVVGPSRGTRVTGLGSGVAKQPRTRGPSQPAEPRNEAVELELATLRAKQKHLEELLQQQEQEREREREERERERQDRERERQDRERERLEWEARIQAQFAEMARQMRTGTPPSDGSNFH